MNFGKLLTCAVDDLKAWLTYKEADAGEPAVEFLVACATAEDQAEFMGRFAKVKPNDEQWRDFWLGHVHGWRGVRVGSDVLPFEASLLKVLWARDPKFRVWLINECQEVDRFLA